MSSDRNLIIRSSIILALAFIASFAEAQKRPRLVVGIVIDQMRWDYLERFKNRWHTLGAFNRLMQGGFSCNSTYINYLPSYTASGHASIFTGTFPAIHGITGNSWWDNTLQGYSYCTGDDSVKTVGSSTDLGHMSPVNLLTTTIADQLKIATSFKNKSIGIALKDRGGILAAGHSADAAYWYDSEEGKWITSTYYMDELPSWVTNFRTTEKVDSLYKLDWHLLYKEESYLLSSMPNLRPAAQPFGTPSRRFPVNLKRYAGENYGILPAIPQGNTLTTEFAKAAILGEKLGADTITDMLAISYSSTDYIGHAFGPVSKELEDAFLRLDIELGQFFDFLDKQIGKDEWLVFITSDHGVAPVPTVAKNVKLPAGNIEDKLLNNGLNEALKQSFGIDQFSKGINNLQVILNIDLIKKVKKVSISDVSEAAIAWLEKQPGILRAVRLEDLGWASLPDAMEDQIKNGYYPVRSGHIQLIYKSGFIEGSMSGGTTHGTGYNYDTRIPLLWYGAKINPGSIYRKTFITDIAPTLSAILGIQEPSGSIGEVITELIDK
ncbi:MAG: alkaline phosphatase family protein [Chitinophagaceae bacterium]|nr:alkaline phosphatase family protein [Chitinophagaceae bacterium]